MNVAGTVILLLPPVTLLGILVAHLLRGAHVMTEAARPALILAAHPDDCVILAGAYAIQAREEGHPVWVAYLTCGAPSPAVERAEVRKREAVAAWGTLAVPRENIKFLDLSEHRVEGPSSWTDANRESATVWIGELLRAMPQRGVVFLPAPGESHVDHRGLRRLALEAWQQSKRSDLTFLEGPEYNEYLSLLQSPKKVLVGTIRAVPVLPRLVRFHRQAWTGFANGGVYWTLPENEARLEGRRDLLRAFASENGDLLVRLFGWYERYRPVISPEHGLADEPPRGYVLLGGRQRGFSALLVLVLLAEGAGLVAALLARAAVSGAAGGATGVRVVVAVAAAVAVSLGARRRAMLESRVLYWALAAGAVAGGVP